MRRELSTIHGISLGCQYPPRAFRRMRDTMETKIRAIRAIQVRDMFSKLVQKKVGTREVEAAAKAVQGPRRTGRNVKEVVRILRRRLEDAEKEIRIKRIKWQRNESDMKKDVKDRSRVEFSKVMKQTEERQKNHFKRFRDSFKCQYMAFSIGYLDIT